MEETGGQRIWPSQQFCPRGRRHAGWAGTQHRCTLQTPLASDHCCHTPDKPGSVVYFLREREHLPRRGIRHESKNVVRSTHYAARSTQQHDTESTATQRNSTTVSAIEFAIAIAFIAIALCGRALCIVLRAACCVLRTTYLLSCRMPLRGRCSLSCRMPLRDRCSLSCRIVLTKIIVWTSSRPVSPSYHHDGRRCPTPWPD